MILVEIMALVAVMFLSKGAYASADYWQITAGDKTIASFNSEEKAKEAVQMVKDHYTEKDASDVAVKVDPILQVQHTFYGKNDKKPATTTSAKAKETIVGENGKNAMVSITTTQTLEKQEKIKYDTEIKESSEAALNTEAVSQKGKKGKQKITYETTSVNGEEVDNTVLDTEVVKEPTTEVVVKGTMEKPADKGTTSTDLGETYSAEAGQQVADFALQFVGNPYVYGGSSLTKGADCSGFVMAVYAHFGLGLPHDAGADRAYGTEVSLSEAQPGDLICYYGHIGIYIGDNQIVHAMNESHGITVSKIGYNGKKILTVRRLLG